MRVKSFTARLRMLRELIEDLRDFYSENLFAELTLNQIIPASSDVEPFSGELLVFAKRLEEKDRYILFEFSFLPSDHVDSVPPDLGAPLAKVRVYGEGDKRFQILETYQIKEALKDV